MTEKNTGFQHWKPRRSLNGRILRSTTLNILILVIVSCVFMAMAMQYLATNILLDSLQPMARQSAKTVEANIHMLADRMMTLAGNLGEKGASQSEILAKTAEIYELHTIALYDLDGKLIQGIDGAPQSIDGDFFAL